jgi:hypothetical protein
MGVTIHYEGKLSVAVAPGSGFTSSDFRIRAATSPGGSHRESATPVGCPAEAYHAATLPCENPLKRRSVGVTQDMVTTTAYRWHAALSHAAIILWQAYIALFAFRSGDYLKTVLTGLGSEVGAGIALFMATHRWWLIVPGVFVVLAYVAIRRLEDRPTFSIALLAVEIVVALAMNIYWREALFMPIFSLIKQVG